MKGRVVALDHIKGRAAAALIVDGKLQDFLIDADKDTTPGPGAILRAICERPLKGQGGMMLRLPTGSGFLRHGRGLRPGQALLVQVTGYAEDGKAIPVTARLLFKSRFAIVTPDAPGLNISRAIRDEEERVRLHDIASELIDPKSGVGVILRSACERADDGEIANDIAAMLEISKSVFQDPTSTGPELLLDGANAHLLAWRDWAAPDLLADQTGSFEDHGIYELLADRLAFKTGLGSGAYAYVEPTRALVAIDVNTGNDTSLAAGLKANMALVHELPALLRCRGLGGQITIDFAPLSKKDRPRIEQALKTAFKSDNIETALAGWTPLGHFELQRKRERLPIDAGLLE